MLQMLKKVAAFLNRFAFKRRDESLRRRRVLPLNSECDDRNFSLTERLVSQLCSSAFRLSDRWNLRSCCGLKLLKRLGLLFSELVEVCSDHWDVQEVGLLTVNLALLWRGDGFSLKVYKGERKITTWVFLMLSLKKYSTKKVQKKSWFVDEENKTCLLS